MPAELENCATCDDEATMNVQLLQGETRVMSKAAQTRRHIEEVNAEGDVENVDNSNNANPGEERSSGMHFQDFLAHHMSFKNQSTRDMWMSKHQTKLAPWMNQTIAVDMLRDEGENDGESDGVVVGQSLVSHTGHYQPHCALEFKDQWFKPREGICDNVNSCSLAACEFFTTILYPHVCYPVYYSNALDPRQTLGWNGNRANHGMCRCLPRSATSATRYQSSSLNSIYDCENLLVH